MEELIARFGLVAVYIGAAVEGDVVLVLAGVTAYLSLLDLPVALTVGAAGCLTSDIVWYVVGRFRSEAVTNSRTYRAVGPTVERIVTHTGPWQIVAARFLYGTRIATMLFWGVHQLPLPRFILIDLLGCAFWAGLLGLLGYAASTSAVLILGEVKRVELWLLGALAASVLAFVIIRIAGVKSRRRPTEI